MVQFPHHFRYLRLQRPWPERRTAVEPIGAPDLGTRGLTGTEWPAYVLDFALLQLPRD